MGTNKTFLASNDFFLDENTDPTKKEPVQEKPVQEIPMEYKPRPEAKTARLQVLLTPSLKETLKRISNAEGKSVNELVNLALKQYTDAYIEELGV